MCEHNKIHKTKGLGAYCFQCKSKLELPRNWSRVYKGTTKVDVYELTK